MTTPKKTGCRVCSDEIYARGLCQKHYRRWMTKYNSFKTEEERIAFEAKCIAEGWITKKTKGGRKRQDDDPFDAIANEIKRLEGKAAAEDPGIDQKKKSG